MVLTSFSLAKLTVEAVHQCSDCTCAELQDLSHVIWREAQDLQGIVQSLGAGPRWIARSISLSAHRVARQKQNRSIDQSTYATRDLLTLARSKQ
jgi:hypothetical protein